VARAAFRELLRSSDVGYAARSLLRSPGFAAAAIVTIALGVGVNTGIFTVLNGVLFRQLPSPRAHELVSITQVVEGVADRMGAVNDGLASTEEYLAYRDNARTLAGLVGHSDPSRTTLGGDSPQQVLGALVTCNWFDVLQQPPLLGRALTERDCAAGAEPVVVLGHELWSTAFAADPGVVGRTIELNRQLVGVVGVASPDTYGGFVYRTAYFAPYSLQPLLLPNEDAYANDRNSWLILLGRRTASAAQVKAELSVIAARLDANEPGRTTTIDVRRATPLSIPFLRNAAVIGATVVMTPFALVLLIACANVANLLLARATARGREIAVRRALGASRARVVRQLLAESLLISLAGGVLGSVLAVWSFQLLVSVALPTLSPAGIPPLILDASPDIRVLTFTLALTFATAIVFGLTPALQASRQDLHSVMKQGAGAGSWRGGRLRGTLVGVQVALCMLLMCGAGLLLRGLATTRTVDPGFVYDGVAVVAFDLESSGYGPEQSAAFARTLRERAAALPGVQSVAFGVDPLGPDSEAAPVHLPGEVAASARFAPVNFVSPGYFSVLGIALTRGRDFTDAELGRDAPVAIVTESTASNYWPGADPLGQRIVVGADRELEVVGVVRDAQVSSVGQVDPYYVYLPATAAVQRLVKLLVRSDAESAVTAANIRGAIRSLDAGLWVRIDPLERNLDWSRSLSGIVTGLAGSLGALALALAAVGIYGVVSYFIGRRSREIGVRMALGARGRDVLALILRQTMRPVVVGAVLGLGAALAAGHGLSSVLFGVNPADALGLGTATAFVLSVALAAGILAGRRATRVEPTLVLREE
jgi:predicted permease